MDVKLPKVGDSADSGTVATLLVRVGDVLVADQTILELEQEKAVAPIRTPSAGTVSAIHVKEGDKVTVGALLISLEAGGKPAASPATAAPAVATRGSAPAKPSANRAPAPVEDDDDEVPGEEIADAEGPVPAASPYVRKVARELGLSLSRV
ncbi:MAG: dihydrolipoyllysine-residue acetyltransferase, partial [Verrucomicrobiota bacterium]